MLSVNIIGCGRLGKTIAKLLYQNSVATINAVVNTSSGRANESVKFIGQGIPFVDLHTLTEADVTFITVKDDKIKIICEELVNLKVLKARSVIIHCSGSLSSDVLMSASAISCQIASVHPVKSFANPDAAVKSFQNTYCTFEGSSEALPILKLLFESIGAKFILLNKEKKVQYHAASVMANNYLVALHYTAVTNFINSGVDQEIAHDLASALMNDGFMNLKKLSHCQALTGPLQRGDLHTIKNHLDALKDDDVSREVYKSLGKAALSLTSHSETIQPQLFKIFNRIE